MMNQSAPFSFKSVPRAGRGALQWRLLLLWVLLMLIPTAIVALPVWQTLSDNFDQSVHVAALAQQLDLTVVADLLSAHGKNAAAFGNAGLVALIVTLLLSPLLSGMAVTAARSAQVAGFAALVSGGLNEYPRMLRMLLWAIVPLGSAIAIGGAAQEAAHKAQAVAVVAADARLADYLATAVTLLLFAVAHATLDAGRAALAIERRRTSAIKAWWSGCKMLVRRPLATLGVYLIISMLGLVLAALLAVARLNVPGGSMAAFIGALVLTQVIVAVLAWMRSARIFAMMDVARSMQKA